MSDLDIVNAWKDMSYRRSLSARQHAAVPPNPAGMIEVRESTARFDDTRLCTILISCPCCENC